MYFKKILVAIALIALTSLNAQEISDTSFGKGLINFVAKDSSFSVKFAPRIQARFNSQWDYDGDSYGDATQNFLLRRARLKFSGFAYSPKLKYKVELGLSNRDVSGASEVFQSGWVVYHESSKTKGLGVDESLISNYGVVSEEVAAALAEGARLKSGSDFALSSTGWAGPDGGDEKHGEPSTEQDQ